MTGFDYICKAIESFENSLSTRDNDKIIKSVSQLAQLAGYSVHHFTRLFFTVTGLHPKEYISKRILCEAAQEIVETNLPLNFIARSMGFQEYETFSRSFKRHFGIPPRQVQENHCLPPGCLAQLVPEIKAGSINLASCEPEIVNMESYCITGLPFFIEEGTKSLHKQWAIFMGVQDKILDRINPESFCQFSSWTDSESQNGMSILCALETAPGATQEAFFTSRMIPEATYIRFVHIGDVSTLYETYRYIYCDWFALQEIKPIESWECQRYTDEEKIIEICIPIAVY